jgi:EAL domain-containing protein (putative c-di-GMP-specific phosphodiesterase class I)
VQDLLAKDIWIDGQRLFISTSIGYVVREGEITAKELYRDAEIAFHVARAGGGSLAVPFDDSLRQQTVERMLFEKDLKRALDNWEFEIYYQPKVTLTQLRTVGFEALIRWRHPERGIVPPSHFIPLAESNGLIIPIGIRTVREACLCLRQWHEQFPQVPPIEVSVNMSTLQFKDRNLIPEIRQILIDTGVPPESLKLEVTESVLVDNPERALAIAEELRRMGVGLKIDDFGTGYSSLSYLHRLPFDTLKIDRSFISGMTTDHTAFEIVRAIVALAQNLGLHVVAEGVETRAQMEELRTLGCDFGQGYLFAPPLNREAATRLLESEAQAQARLRATL